MIDPEAPDEDLLRLAALARGTPTPFRIHMPRRGKEGLRRLADGADRVFRQSGVPLEIAYSVKTNPHPTLLRMVAAAGLLAEVIGEDEARAAAAAGFASDRLVRGGPWPLRSPAPDGGAYRAVFADGLEALAALPPGAARLLGLRLRPRGLNSRFGMPVGGEADFRAIRRGIEAACGNEGFGLSMHAPLDRIGLPAWLSAARAFLDAARSIAADLSTPLVTLDFGGGYTPELLESGFASFLPDLAREAARVTPTLRNVLIEPGKALAQDLMALATRVIERRRRDPAEIVVDASIIELSMARHRRHPVYWVDAEGRPRRFGRGRGRILGRICMEQDRLAGGLDLPDGLEEGSLILFDTCGAYDSSLSHPFGRGESADRILDLG